MTTQEFKKALVCPGLLDKRIGTLERIFHAAGEQPEDDQKVREGVLYLLRLRSESLLSHNTTIRKWLEINPTGYSEDTETLAEEINRILTFIDRCRKKNRIVQQLFSQE